MPLLPLCLPKLLELSPAFTGHQVTYPGPESIASRALQVRRVAFRIGYPSEDLGRDDFLTQSADFDLVGRGDVGR